MHLMYFTEQPMSAYPEQEGRDFGATALMFSNKNFDPVAGSRLYNEYLEHYRLAEEVGYSGGIVYGRYMERFHVEATGEEAVANVRPMTKRLEVVIRLAPPVRASKSVYLARS